VCTFDELNKEFIVRREIGRGIDCKELFEIIKFFIGSYGVVFKAVRTSEGDIDENGKKNQYAIKRIFPTINAAFILIEMLILKLLK
jgi:hypothetical protein